MKSINIIDSFVKSSMIKVIIIGLILVSFSSYAETKKTEESQKSIAEPNTIQNQIIIKSSVPEHDQFLRRAVDRIASVPSGQDLLKELKGRFGPTPVLFASADPKLFEDQTNAGLDPELRSRVVEAANAAGEKIQAIYINIPRLERLQQSGTLPAGVVREVFSGLFDAVRHVDRIKDGQERLRARLFVDAAWNGIEGDRFVGELTPKNEEIRYNLHEMLNSVWVLPEQKFTDWLGSFLKFDERTLEVGARDVGRDGLAHLIDQTEQIRYLAQHAYTDDLAWGGKNLPSGVRLGLNPVATGSDINDYRITPLRLLLNLFDTRIDWKPIKTLNDALIGKYRAPPLATHNNHNLLDWSRRFLREGRLGELMDGIAQLHISTGGLLTYTNKASPEVLMDRVMAHMQKLKDSGEYSAADFEYITRGLQLPERLKSFIESLTGRPMSLSPNTPPPAPSPVVKLKPTATPSFVAT